MQETIVGSECYTCWYFIKVRVNDSQNANFRITVSRVDENLSGQFREMRTGTPVRVYIASGYYDRRKFLLSSMDNFVLLAYIANGDVDMYVGLDPATVGPNSYVWKATKVSPGLRQITVKTTDANFHMGTMYYVYTQAISSSDAIVSIGLSQEKSVNYVTNNHDSLFTQTTAYYNEASLFQKQQYQSIQEQVKFFVF